MNILVLTYWSFKEGLVQTYTLPYLRQITSHLKSNQVLYLVTFEKENLVLTNEEKQKYKQELAPHRIVWMPFGYSKPGLFTYIKNLFRLLKLYFFVFVKRISHIHTFCTPAGAMGSILSFFSPTTLVLDSFEPHAESMVENGQWSPSSFKYRILYFLEKFQVRLAKYVICTTRGMMSYTKDKYNVDLKKKKHYVKPACVDLNKFGLIEEKEILSRRQSLGFKDEIVAVYAGKLGGIYYDKEVFEFLKVAYEFWDKNFKFLMLTNTSRDDIDKFCAEVGLPSEVVISKFVMHDEVPHYLSVGDFGLTPVKSVPTKRYCTPIKDGEYWALGLPVVITPNISDDSQIIIENGIGAIMNPQDQSTYLQAVERIDGLLTQDGEVLKTQIRSISEQYRSFEISDKIYRDIYS